jgi:hypothetical protein
MCGMFLFFHNIYIYGRKIPMKSGIFARGRRMSDKIRQKKTGLAERCGAMSNFRGEATNFRGEAPGDRGEATNFRGEATNFRGAMSSFRGEATNFRGEATGGTDFPSAHR